MSDDHAGKGVPHLPPGEERRYALGQMGAPPLALLSPGMIKPNFTVP
ncbi:hypothetical protein [Paracoccus versutus]|uniref:Uncharacterized protein n=1 Tax=Paracoccus versutus TaxID=34007 RepID=A0A3D9XSR9_PARVE|nr:hypothetical protein [Paracoccus versutus]REF73487.1 hypothetical protein BDD41_2047 [Paracoccus versutus]